MSSNTFIRTRVTGLAAMVLATLIAVLATALPIVSYCCLTSSPCCAGNAVRQVNHGPLLGAPLPLCCQQIVPSSRVPLGERTVSVGSVSLVATLPYAPAIAFLQAAFHQAIPTAAAPADPLSHPHPARAPPLS